MMIKINRNSFTLIELLIVVAVIIILFSLLQPTFQRLHKSALTLNCQNDLSLLQTGFIAFADDNDGYLPDSPLNGNFNDMNAFYLRNRLDWRPIAEEYGFMAVTGNHVTGAATWDHIGNHSQYWKRDSRQYYPKNNLNSYQTGIRSPTNLSIASSRQSMFMDLLRVNPNGEYYGIHGEGGDLYHPPGSTSMRVFFDFIPDGVHTAFMDGSTRWVEFHDLKFYNRGTFKHAYTPRDY